MNSTSKILILFLQFLFVYAATGQIATKYKSYSQKTLEKNKVFDSTYDLWSSKYSWGSEVKDTITYFVDDRNYKGVINYGVEYRSRDFKLFNFFESKSMCFLEVNFERCSLNLNDSIINIEGFVSGGWGDHAKRGKENPKNFIDVFLGEKIDTISVCYLKIRVNKEFIETKLNNKITEKNEVLDTFPSFYFKKASYFRTVEKGKRPFKITGKVNKNTILAFGGSGCYTEIFDIGAMVFTPDKNRKTKTTKSVLRQPKVILSNNKLTADIEKDKNTPKEVNYYTYSEKAENYIMKNQFAKAKETYLILEKEYSTLYARDIHNAIRCAVVSKDFKNAYYWGERVAKKGVNIKYFDAKIFQNLKKNVDWKKFSIRFDSIASSTNKTLNQDLKRKLEQLLQEDQSDYGLENRKESEILYRTTERVTAKFIELLKTEGFPSEEKIGVYTKNDTILISSPDYYVLIRHAVQQKPKSIDVLSSLLNKSLDAQEYDKNRNANHRGFGYSCFQIYKGNLYNDKSCGVNEMMKRKIKFGFHNKNNFIIDQGDYSIMEYNKDNPEEYDTYFKEKFNFVLKLTEDWEFYED